MKLQTLAQSLEQQLAHQPMRKRFTAVLAEIESILVRRFQSPYSLTETDARECLQFPPSFASLFELKSA